ncbi:MAG TPA: AzlD domain-containing protein [Symbiobacteriaceae bacterium]|nr:AzlD domain-containing protein [Symbiobacteriaceae bacterium]
MLALRPAILLTILGASLVTLLPRLLPFAALRAVTLPGWAERFLRFVPPAVLGALLARELFLVGGKLVLPPANLAPLAILPALVIALWRKSLIGTVLAGVGAMFVLRLFL